MYLIPVKFFERTYPLTLRKMASFCSSGCLASRLVMLGGIHLLGALVAAAPWLETWGGLSSLQCQQTENMSTIYYFVLRLTRFMRTIWGAWFRLTRSVRLPEKFVLVHNCNLFLCMSSDISGAPRDSVTPGARIQARATSIVE